MARLVEAAMTIERAWPGAPRGDHWRAMFYDRATGQIYAGTGGDVWQAIAGAFADYDHRAIRGLGPRVAITLQPQPMRPISTQAGTHPRQSPAARRAAVKRGTPPK